MKLKTHKTLNELSGGKAISGSMRSVDGGPRRFATSVPSERSVAVLEILGKSIKGKKKLFGRPIKEIGIIPSDGTRKIQVKVLRQNTREAAKWLKQREDGKSNGSIGGDQDTICEFDLVKRPRGSKGKAIGVVKRCFIASEGASYEPEHAPVRDIADMSRELEALFGKKRLR